MAALHAVATSGKTPAPTAASSAAPYAAPSVLASPLALLVVTRGEPSTSARICRRWDCARRRCDADLHLGGTAFLGESSVLHEDEAVFQPEGDAFEDGAGHMGFGVAGRQADECAARERVGVGGALAREVGQEQQSFAARWDFGGGGEQVVE